MRGPSRKILRRRPTATTATDPEADEDFDDPLLREFDEDLAREAKERDEKDGKA